MSASFNKFADISQGSDFLLEALHHASSAGLPNWWIVGGAIRDVVWSSITGRPFLVEMVRDIDVVYFDAASTDRERDAACERRLPRVQGVSWSVKNQARMHQHNFDAPYVCVVDAISKFPETTSSIGVKLDQDGSMIHFSCYGFEDLMDMIIRPTPHFRSHQGIPAFRDRIRRRGWLQKWPTAKIHEQ